MSSSLSVLRTIVPRKRAQQVGYALALAAGLIFFLQAHVVGGLIWIACLSTIRLFQVRREPVKLKRPTNPDMPDGLFFEGTAEALVRIRPGRHRVLAPCPASDAPQPTHAVMSLREFRRLRGGLTYWCQGCHRTHLAQAEELTLAEWETLDQSRTSRTSTPLV